jgi:bifunctional DNase/RNase
MVYSYRAPEKHKSLVVPVLVFLAIVFAIVGGYFSYMSNVVRDFEGNSTEIDKVNVIYRNNTPELLLMKGCYALKMQISEDQAFSIGYGLSDQKFYRPLTHDLMKEVFDFFDIKLLGAKVSYKDERDTYHSSLLLSNGLKIYQVDVRNTDMVALAVRYKAKMRIDDSLLTSFENIC